jgi:hypothetical protein
MFANVTLQFPTGVTFFFFSFFGDSNKNNFNIACSRHKRASTNDSLLEISKMKNRNWIP